MNIVLCVFQLPIYDTLTCSKCTVYIQTPKTEHLPVYRHLEIQQ